MIKKYISGILIFCLITMVLPTMAFAIEQFAPTVKGRNIYGNGTALIVEGTDSTHTTVYIDANRNGTVDDGEESLKSAGIASAPNDDISLSSWTILGGAESSNLDCDSMVTINSGSIGDVFGGAGGLVTGNITIVLNGGSVKRLIATGYYNKVGSTDSTVYIAVHGGNVLGGENDDIDMISRIATGTAKVLTIDGGTINGTISGATPTNGTEDVLMTTLTLKDGEAEKANAAVDALTLNAGTYGMNDVTTNSRGQLVVYLPSGKIVTAATIGENSYLGSVMTGYTGELLKVMPPLWTDGISANISAPFSGGEGTQALPYLLSSADDLAQLAVNVNSGISYLNTYFRLTKNVNLSEKYWVPIGYGTSTGCAFSGHFDGDNHVVDNMNILRSACVGDTYFLGFFAWVYGGASVKNIGLTNASLTVDSWSGHDVGLLAGYADNGIDIDNCFANGTINASVTIRSIGGLIGQNYYGGNLTNCYFVGRINSAGGSYVGGIVAYQRSAVPINCYAAATILSSATNKYAVASSATNCYYDCTLNTTAVSGQGTPKTGAEMKTPETATNLGAAWGYNANINNGYPYLVSFFAPEITLTNSNVSVANLYDNARLVLASYVGKRLIDIKILSVSTPESLDISETGLITQGADMLKAMLWMNPINLRPLCKVEEVLHGEN